MIKHITRVMHRPPHSYGDCLRATIASYLNIPNIEDVPHFYESGDDKIAQPMLHNYLASRGYMLFKTAVHNCALDDVFAMMRDANPGVQYMLFCQCGGDDHVLLCQDDKVIHNTAMFPTPVSGPHSSGFWGVLLVTPINP